MSKNLKVLTNGIIKENPTLVLLLGMCPTLATTTGVINGLGMGISAAVVLVMANIAISLVRKFIPSKIRIASFVVIIAGFVTMVDMLLKAYFPSISASLGIFIPLIVVNCIILARAESFASKNTWAASAMDGLGMGAGFTLALVLLASVREIAGNGSFAGIPLFGDNFSPALVFLLPPGGFIAFGVLLAVINFFRAKKEAKHD
ncbi:MAG: electron transport complex subunit E [Clostridiales bacterium]|jgi:electron transport complex protein RnfE|nr:electron transport complex subunit E [Clostridiales bacterium]